jgi:hypothetical protein
MTKFVLSIALASVVIGLVIYGFVSGGITQLIILVCVAAGALGLVVRSMWKLNEIPPKDDLGNYHGGY